MADNKPAPNIADFTAGDKTTPIPLGGNPLMRFIGSWMQPREDASLALRAITPEFHDKLTPVPTISGARADQLLAQATRSRSVQASRQPDASQSRRQRPNASAFRRGDTVYDERMGKKGTITVLAAGQSSNGTPKHKVIDRHGNTWLQKERHLRKA